MKKLRTSEGSFSLDVLIKIRVSVSHKFIKCRKEEKKPNNIYIFCTKKYLFFGIMREFSKTREYIFEENERDLQNL